MKNSFFSSEEIITEEISNSELKAYFVGYDFGEFRYDALVDKILSAVVDFSFGYHEGVLSTYKIEELRNAAKLVYKIEDYDPNNPDHRKSTKINGKNVKVPYKDEKEFKELRYYNRGEFGELILHLLLRDFQQTLPLLSKIYMKDSRAITVKGFDAVHIGDDLFISDRKSIYFGESKLHRTGKTGIHELIDDIKLHFTRDFLNDEFLLIGNKKNNFLPLEDYKDKNSLEQYQNFLKMKDYWYDQIRNAQKGKLKLNTLFKSVTVPMLCTYTSKTLLNKTDETSKEFLDEFNNEVKQLNKDFKSKFKEYKSTLGVKNPITTDLNIVLMLFPVPDKKELVKRIHDKLYHQQRI